MEHNDLSTIHGDTWYSPVWAVVNSDGTTKDLTGWSVRAQLRRIARSTTAIYAWDLNHGIDIKSASVRLASGTVITTDAVQLRLAPGDYTDLPLNYTGVIDVEIASDSSDDPDERYTVVSARPFSIYSDVTRG